VAQIISEDAPNFDLDIAYEMLLDACKLAEADPDMALTLFTRWLTMKAEQPLTELSVTQEQYQTLMTNLYPQLSAEFQTQALCTYLQSYGTLKEVISNMQFYGESNILDASALLAGFHWKTRKNADLTALADGLIASRNKFSDEDKFCESISSVTVFVTKTKDFAKADELIEATGLPTDPNVCLSYLREYLNKETSTSRVEDCLDK